MYEEQNKPISGECINTICFSCHHTQFWVKSQMEKIEDMECRYCGQKTLMPMWGSESVSND